MERVRIHDFYVGRWLVQPSLNQIIDGAHTVRIPPKYIDVLVVLAEHPGEVVPRDHLLDTVWADTIVVESVLTRAVFELRKVFDDDAQHPQVIETILKTGYRLIAPVASAGHHRLSTPLSLSDGTSDGMETPALPTLSERSPTSPDALYLTPSPTPSVEASPRSAWRLAGLATMGLALLALSGWLWLRPTSRPTTTTARYTLTPATTLQGREVNPALSPSGQHLAFVWDGGTPGAWDLYVKPIDDGLYFVNHDETGSVIRFFQTETGRVTEVASFATFVSGMSVSPDGAWLLYGQGQPGESDIMLLDNLQ